MAHIILQAPRLSAADIERLAAVACAGGVQELGPTAVRLLDVDPDCRDEALAQAAAARMDAAWLDTVHRLGDCRVLAMDMDSTLVNIEASTSAMPRHPPLPACRVATRTAWARPAPIA